VQDEREVGGDLGPQLSRSVRLEQVGRTLQVRLGDGPVTQAVVDLGQLVLDDGEIQLVSGIDGRGGLLVGQGCLAVAAESEQRIATGLGRSRARAPLSDE
jgi:hypothetical protein